MQFKYNLKHPRITITVLTFTQAFCLPSASPPELSPTLSRQVAATTSLPEGTLRVNTGPAHLYNAISFFFLKKRPDSHLSSSNCI